MQEQRAPEQMHDASLGFRFAAIVIDTVVLFVALVVLFTIAAAAGALDVTDPSLNGGFTLERTAPAWVYVVTYGLIFVYYSLFETLTGASVGKLALGMRVTMDDGSRPTGGAIVLRNLIRLPEVLFWYVPSGISCLANARNKRLGDLAAGTVVRRRGAGPAGALEAASRLPSPVPGGPPPPPTVPGLSESVAAFKAAALAVAGAHRAYIHYSELELAASGAAADEAADGAGVYAPEYVAAWYTLTDTVVTAQKELAAAEASAARAGTTIGEACADQPDVERLLRELEPYLTAASDDQIHDAYLSVARGETAI